MVFMIKNMKIIKDKYITNCARYTKVELDNKYFRRYHYGYKNRTVDILWLSSDREFINEKLELHLENQFKIINKNLL